MCNDIHCILQYLAETKNKWNSLYLSVFLDCTCPWRCLSHEGGDEEGRSHNPHLQYRLREGEPLLPVILVFCTLIFVSLSAVYQPSLVHLSYPCPWRCISHYGGDEEGRSRNPHLDREVPSQETRRKTPANLRRFGVVYQ